MTTTYQERPRKGGGTECLLANDTAPVWRKLLPIALTAENAQKVHTGKKTQTRRLAKKSKHDGAFVARYRVGDVLWIQEPWRTHVCFNSVKPTELNTSRVLFESDGKNDGGKLRPVRFLPLRFARPDRYLVTEVRLERVMAISPEDIRAEGGRICDAPRAWFHELWNSIHAAPGSRFEDAPWVFAYTFRRIEP